MNKEIKNFTLAFICNVVTLLIFAKIALVFNKWWVILFAIFFWHSVEEKISIRREENDDSDKI